MKKGVQNLAGTFSILPVCQVFQKMAYFRVTKNDPLHHQNTSKWVRHARLKIRSKKRVLSAYLVDGQNVGISKGKNQVKSRYRKKVQKSQNHQNGQNRHHLQNHDIKNSTS